MFWGPAGRFIGKPLFQSRTLMRGELPSGAGFGVLFGAPQNVLQALL